MERKLKNIVYNFYLTKRLKSCENLNLGGVAMKRLVAFLFFLVIVWTLVGCDKKSVGDVSSVTFEAEILEI